MKKKVLIVTLNDYIIYQPTILNLYDALAPYCDVTIISFEPRYISKKKDEQRNIIYIKTHPAGEEFFGKMDFILSKAFKALGPILRLDYYYRYYNFYLPALLKRKLKHLAADRVIAVDIPALYVAQQVFGAVDFLSLEIDRTIPHFKKVDQKKIRSVFIQSQLRYDHLFPGVELKRFIVQNSPVFDNIHRPVPGRRDFVWAGTILERFGVMDCLDFFEHYHQYKIVLKGGGDKKTIQKVRERFGHLIDTGRVILDQAYLPSDQFIDFLAGFRIGFCFYSWELIAASFNYQSAPSGKLFMYLAAGTPVIACNIPGFSLVNDFKVGVLINDYKPETILGAVKEIESNYEEYSANCYKAAEHFSFDKAVKPYVDYLLKEN